MADSPPGRNATVWPNNHLSSLYVDGENTLWIGTLNGGLSRLKKGRFVTITTQDGLPSNSIGSLLEDDLGNLWLGSNRGIIRVNRQALNDYADGERRPLDWHVFGLSDGLSTIGCAEGGQPACWKAHDGKIWFATIKGVAVVDPHHLPRNPLPPPVVIEEVVMDDQVYDLQSSGSQAELPTRQGPMPAGVTNPHAGNSAFRFMEQRSRLSPSRARRCSPSHPAPIELSFTSLA